MRVSHEDLTWDSIGGSLRASSSFDIIADFPEINLENERVRVHAMHNYIGAYGIILGRDFMARHGINLNFAAGNISFGLTNDLIRFGIRTIRHDEDIQHENFNCNTSMDCAGQGEL